MIGRHRVVLLVAVALVTAFAVAALTTLGSAPPAAPIVGQPVAPVRLLDSPSPPPQPPGWAYQLRGYPGGRLDALARGPYAVVVIGLDRDERGGWFSAAEIRRVRGGGRRVLASFKIGSIEDFRPEYAAVRRDAPDLTANPVPGHRGERFGRYWDERWWQLVVQPRVDQAIRAGFDGVVLDTPAYGQIDRGAMQRRDRDQLGDAAIDLIARISGYAKAKRPGFLIVAPNADGVVLAGTREHLAEARALRDAGRLVLVSDYVTRAADVRAVCRLYRDERLTGTVTVRSLDRLPRPCPG